MKLPVTRLIIILVALSLMTPLYVIVGACPLYEILQVDRNADCCVSTLKGVTCKFGQVVSIELAGTALEGTLPDNIDELQQLRTLDLTNNMMFGTLPASISNLVNLRSLILRRNRFRGTIPSVILNMTALERLNLGFNRLIGSIPDIGNLDLLELDLSQNSITGSFPDSMSRLRRIEHIVVNTNLLEGTIPASFGHLRTLKSLHLHSTFLSGTIPPQLGLLSRLNDLQLHINAFTGTIPSSICDLSELQRLRLGHNRLTGTLPTRLGNFRKLVHLSIESTSLTGSLPASIANLTALEIFHMGNSLISGTIPRAMGDLTSLFEWFAQYNRLSGTIPAELGKLRQLTYLDLSGQKSTEGLWGPIPYEIGNLPSIGILRLNGNKLTGTLPVSLGSLGTIWELSLQDNPLSGVLPDIFGGLGNLTKLNISFTKFSGSLPPSLSGLPKLTTFDAQRTLLSGNFHFKPTIKPHGISFLQTTINFNFSALPPANEVRILGLPLSITNHQFCQLQFPVLEQLAVHFLPNCSSYKFKETLVTLIIDGAHLQVFDMNQLATTLGGIFVLALLHTTIDKFVVLSTPMHYLHRFEMINTSVASMKINVVRSSRVERMNSAAIPSEVEGFIPIMSKFAYECFACALAHFFDSVPFTIAALIWAVDDSIVLPSLRELVIVGCKVATGLDFRFSQFLPPYEKSVCKNECFALGQQYSVLSSFFLADEDSSMLPALSFSTGVNGPDLDLLFQYFYRSVYHSIIPWLQTLGDVKHPLAFQLQIFDVSENEIPGSLLSATLTCGIDTLQILRAGSNRFSGLEWRLLLGAQQLVELDLSNNVFVAVMPPIEVRQDLWTMLSSIDFSRNPGLRFNASSWYLTSSKLVKLNLSGTAGYGIVPYDFFRFDIEGLIDVNLKGLPLTGAVPARVWDALRRSYDLLNIDLSDCQFSWFAPDSLASVNDSLRGYIHLGHNPWICDPIFVERGINGSASAHQPEVCVTGIRMLDHKCHVIQDFDDVVCHSAPFECAVNILEVIPSPLQSSSHTMCHNDAPLPCWDAEMRELEVSRGSQIVLSVDRCLGSVCENLNASLIFAPQWNPLQSNFGCHGAFARAVDGNASTCSINVDLRYDTSDGFPIVVSGGLKVAVCQFRGETAALIAMLRVVAPVHIANVLFPSVIDQTLPPGSLPSQWLLTFVDSVGLQVDVNGLLRLDVYLDGEKQRLLRLVQSESGPDSTFDLSAYAQPPGAKLTFVVAVSRQNSGYKHVGQLTIEVDTCADGRKTYYNMSSHSCQNYCALESTCEPDSRCPRGGVCNGSSFICAQVGWWRAGGACSAATSGSDYRAVVIFDECVGVGCLGGVRDANTTSSRSEHGCAPGYGGVLCQACRSFEEHQYVLDGELNCRKCPPTFVSVLLVSVLFLGAVLWIAVVVVTQARAAVTLATQQLASSEMYGELSMYLKLLLSMIQTSAVMDRAEVEWTGPMDSLETAFQTVIGLFDDVFLKCLVPRLAHIDVRLYAICLVFLALFLVFNIAMYVLWRFKCRGQSWLASSSRWLRRNSTLLVTLSVVLYALYAQVTIAVATSFVTVSVSSRLILEGEIGVERYQLMDVDLRKEPPSSDAYKMNILAIVSTVLCVVGYPVFLGVWVILLKKWLRSCFVVRSVMGIFLVGYRDGIVWFEFLRLTRTSLSLVASALAPASFQIGFLGSLLLLELLATILLRPYEGSAQNLQVFTLSCQQLQIVIVGALLGSSLTSYGLLQDAFQWSLILLDILVISAFIVEIAQGFLVLLERVDRLRRVVVLLGRVIAKAKALLFHPLYALVGFESHADRGAITHNSLVEEITELKQHQNRLDREIEFHHRDLHSIFVRLLTLRPSPVVDTLVTGTGAGKGGKQNQS